MSRPLYLAAGTVLDAAPVDVIEAAAAAGFDGLGLRLDTATLDEAGIRSIGARLRATGMTLFDLEVIRVGAPGAGEDAQRLLDVAGELGAQWVLTVSQLPDSAESVRALQALAISAADRGVGIALEFMRFTELRSIEAAVDAVIAVGQPNIAVLVDALHLFRTGGTVEQVAALSPAQLAYAQLCDAPATAPSTTPELADEARHSRLMPGAGDLPLTGFVAALPDQLPITVEVQSDLLGARLDPSARAQLAFDTAVPYLSPR
jgi:sugar phosphate isomerase/epimerase